VGGTLAIGLLAAALLGLGVAPGVGSAGEPGLWPTAAVRDGPRLAFERRLWLVEPLETGDEDGSLVEWSWGLVSDRAEEEVTEPQAWLTELGVGVGHSYHDRPAPAAPGDWRGSSVVELKTWATTRVAGGDARVDSELLGYSPVPGIDSPDEALPRHARLRFTGGWSGVRAGLELRSLGRGLEKVTGPKAATDQEGVVTWLERGFGPLRLTVTGSQLEDNVARDPARPRTRKALVETNVGVTLPFGPVLGLGYLHGTSERRPPARGGSGRSRTAAFDSLVCSVYYARPTWDVTLSTTSTPTHVGDRRDSLAASHDLALTYRPADRVTVTPVLGVSELSYDRTGLRTETATAAVSLTYGPIHHVLDLTLYGAHTSGFSSDDLYDATTISAAAGLVWHVRRAAPQTTVSFEVGYDAYLDAVYPGGSSRTLFGQIVLKIAGF
jgi:hypothetical protein